MPTFERISVRPFEPFAIPVRFTGALLEILKYEFDVLKAQSSVCDAIDAGVLGEKDVLPNVCDPVQLFA